MNHRFVSFVVYGTPAPKGSKMALGGRQVFESERTIAHEGNIRETAIKHVGPRPLPADQTCLPVSVDLYFYLPAPKWVRARRKVTRRRPVAFEPRSMRKPDVDKLARTVLDALTRVLYDDDSQVVSLTCHKRYAGENDYPRTSVLVSYMAPEEPLNLEDDGQCLTDTAPTAPDPARARARR